MTKRLDSNEYWFLFLCLCLCAALLMGAWLIFGPPRPTHDMTTEVQIGEDHRVVVKRIDVISDSVAYNSRRGIYVITDTLTDKEYIGVSGVGITETGRHGKHGVLDER